MKISQNIKKEQHKIIIIIIIRLKSYQLPLRILRKFKKNSKNSRMF